MFNFRLLWKSLPLVERTPSYCKCIKAPKSNLIKTFNTENKYLYGGLIENQKQRRKKISKVPDSSPDLEKEDHIEPKNISSQTKSNAEKVKLSRNWRSKSLETADNHITDKLIVLKSKSNVESPSIEVLPTTEKKPSAKKSSKMNTKSSKSKEIDSSPPVKHSEEVNVALAKEFTFQSLVVINDQNYPLSNSNKEDISPKHNVQDVLCLGFSDSAVKEYLKYPSVSKIMEQTMTAKSRFILSRWRQNMIKDLGEEGFSKHLAGLKTRGQEFHLAVRGAVLGERVDSAGEVANNALKSLEWLLQHISNPMAVESLTAHPALEYKGIPDCIAMFKDIPVLIDWKLSDKPKKDLKDTYEAPVQISAYIGALNHDPNYKWAVSHGLVAVAYASGDPCDVFLLAPKHCQIYWRHWLLRFDKFKATSHLHLDHQIDEKELELV